MLNRAQAWQLLFTVFDEFDFEIRRTFQPGVIVSEALVLASRCADHLVDIAAVEADCDEIIAVNRWKNPTIKARGRKELCQVVAAYDRRKHERHLLDYGDQIRFAVQLLVDHAEVAAGLRAQYPVALLDEYQDTNYAQRVLLEQLYGPGSAVTAVGDDMQSIYAFRGAHLENILDFGAHFPPAQQLPLTVNRRSGRELVELANRIQGQVTRRHEKELQPLPEARPTVIECFLAEDEATEATEIARGIVAYGAPWRRSAVLCRKRRLIAPIVDALERAGVPVEVAGSSGLLDRPEVVDLMAWLEVLADVTNSIALLRILAGPQYRIGWRDLAALARAAREVGRQAGRSDIPFTIGEVVTGDLSALEDVSPEARRRLARFVEQRGALGQATTRLPVLDVAETIIGRTGLWVTAGKHGRENLLRFLDVAERFRPVEGNAALADFVEYVQLLDEAEEDLAEAHLSGDDADAVRVMTIHQAKGLEFPSVWVPGLTIGVFPDRRGGENPLSAQNALPWWLTANEAGLPSISTAATMKEIDDAVRTRHRDEEWRLLYVACTRAERRLTLSAAQWYVGASEPQGRSLFYDFIAAQTDVVTELYQHEPAAVDPQVAAMERRRTEADKRIAAAAAVTPKNTGGPPSLFDDPAIVPMAPAPRRAPSALSVTNLVSFARCPRQFYWSAVRPLPRTGSTAARIGTEVHRRIELRASRQLVLLEPEVEFDHDLAEPDIDRVGAEDIVTQLTSSFVASPYAELDPERVEAPFVLVVEGVLVRGRIDAVYRRDGKLELVDFKTGLEPDPGDASALVQLDLYALAAVDTWGVRAEDLRTSYCYLRAGGPAEVHSSDWDEGRIAAVRRELGARLAAIAGGRYPTTPGAWCRRCDFVDACPTGRAAIASGE